MTLTGCRGRQARAPERVRTFADVGSKRKVLHAVTRSLTVAGQVSGQGEKNAPITFLS